MSKLAPCAMAYEQRPVGNGSALLIQVAHPSVLPAVPWPRNGLHVVVLHLAATPPPVLVSLLPRLRDSLGANLLYLAWHGKNPHDAFEALRLTGNVLRGGTADHSLSCWGSDAPATLPVITAPVIRHGDLSNRTAAAILELAEGVPEALEIWPRRGRFAAAAVRAGCKPTVVAQPTDKAYDRLTSFLDRRKR